MRLGDATPSRLPPFPAWPRVTRSLSRQVTEGPVGEIIRPRPQGSSPVYEYVTEGAGFGLPVSQPDRHPQSEGRLRCGAPRGRLSSCITLSVQPPCPALLPPATAMPSWLSSPSPLLPPPLPLAVKVAPVGGADLTLPWAAGHRYCVPACHLWRGGTEGAPQLRRSAPSEGSGP